MGWVTRALGLTLKVPTDGTQNWGTGLLADFVDKISAHDHQGSGKGLAITKAALSIDGTMPQRVRLASTICSMTGTHASAKVSWMLEYTYGKYRMYFPTNVVLTHYRCTPCDSSSSNGVVAAGSATFEIYKNGSTTGVTFDIDSTDADHSAGALSSSISLTTSDYIEIWNETASLSFTNADKIVVDLFGITY